ncbi:lasso peptide biosynthesis PqqD family chaperone [Streptosporangium sp. NPDC006930]|uniref:lasso peptide biosynthesis PqqD family chaperone n=1 Tax=unclassified Streptosporangium TaxID=2632669 RepID=UPI003444F8AE
MSFSLAPHVSMTDMGQSLVLLNERSGGYWLLNATGAVVVRLLLQGVSVPEVVAQLGRSHPASVHRIPTDVEKLLVSLREARVVTP